MNLEVDGTKKIILVEESQGLVLNTETKQSAVAITGVTAVSWLVDVQPPLINSGDRSNPNLSIAIGQSSETVAAGDDSRIVGALQKSNNLSDLASKIEARLHLDINNVDNTSDVNKPISTAVQNALDEKISTAAVILNYVPLTDSRLSVQSQNVASVRAIAGTGTATTVAASDHTHTKADVGLSNVDNTSDSTKNTNFATQSGAIKTALDSKLNSSDAASTYVTLSDSRLTDERTPPNGSITGNKITSGGLPPSSIAGTAVITTDSRLSDARDPKAHTHPISDITDLQTALNQKSNTDHTHTYIDNNLSMHGNKITNLADITETATGDYAVNKRYVDRVAVGLKVHTQVEYTTTGPITLSGTSNQYPNLDYDGTDYNGSRILVKNQTLAKDNGIYVANTSGAWSRASDMSGSTNDDWKNNVVGAYVFIDKGSTLINTAWFANVDNFGIETIGTTPIIFNKFSSITLTPGNGISITGGSISTKLASVSGLDNTGGLSVVANPTTPTITIGPSGLSVKYNVTKGLTATANGLEIKTSTGISMDATNGLYIANGAITNDMLFGSIDLTTKVGSSILPIENGGTGANDATGARSNLGLGTAAVRSDTYFATASDVSTSLSNKQDKDPRLTSLSAKTSTGIISQTGSSSYESRTIQATSPIQIDNGNGVSGNPLISLISSSSAGQFLAGPKDGGGSISLRNINGSDIKEGVVDISRLPTGTGSSQVAFGNHTHTFRTTQSFSIQGNIVTSDLSGLAIPPFFAAKTSNQTINLVQIIHKIQSGTSVLFWVTRNGSQIVPVSPSVLTATTTKTTETSGTTNLPISINNGDEITIYINGILGNPVNLSVTLVFEHIIQF